MAVSAFEGTAGEGIFLNSWGSTGEFYICVRGRNGAFDVNSPFRLDVVLVPGGCEGVVPAPAGSLVAVSGGFRTLVLADWGRMNPVADPGVAVDLANLQAKLATFVARAEVAGVVVDVGTDAAVAFANSQADAHAGCVFAKNLVAEAIRDIVIRYRDQNPSLESVMVLGNDDIIPYFRHPDTAGLASEQNFIVPVLDQTASQASLRLGYVLSQDGYGTTCEVEQKFTTLPVADLPVGRLVETAAEIQGLLDAYLTLTAGRLPTPAASLVTGYDFLVDAAEAIDAEFRAGMGLAPTLIHDRLIAPRGVSPEADPDTTQNWSAAELAEILFARRHDLIFLAGHYNDGSALAADYATELTAAEVEASTVDMVNALVFGAGCHVGYNTVDPHSIPDVTQKPDWAQALARKQVTAFIGGTGYQYGDTELVEYHERLYQEFARQLRTGTGPVSVGRALVEAKRAYLRGTASLRGIHEKTLLETTLFGFPMLTLDLPGERLPSPSGGSIVPAPTGYSTNPGLTLELKRTDLTVTVPSFVGHSVDLQRYGPAGPQGVVTATYLSGPDGYVNNPAEPILPLLVRNITSPTLGEVLRGVGFRSGLYADESGVTPLTGMPATEIRGVAVTFESEFFFPVQPWSVGYFDTACGGELTWLNLFPVQHQTRTEDDTVSRRRFSELGFRLFYSANTKTYTDAGVPDVPSTPWLADAPSIAQVTDSLAGTDLTISAQVVGNPSAGIQEVWVTYTAVSGAWYGQWQSLDLVQQVDPVVPEDSRVWKGTFTLPAGLAASDVRYLVQAVNGVGLVTMDSNQGRYFTPGHSPAVEPFRQATTLTFENFPLTRAYGELATFSAILATPAGPILDERVSFGLGNAHLVARTDAQGRVRVTFPLVNQPATYKLQATFAGSSAHQPASATTQFELIPQDTFIRIEDLTTTRPNLNVRATLLARNGQALPNGDPLVDQSLFFVLTDAAGEVLVARPVITDYVGRAPLGILPLGAGTYTLRVYFNGQVPLDGTVSSPSLATQLSDPRYNSSSATGIFTFTLVAAPQTIYRAAGRTAKISVSELLAASKGIEGTVLSLVSVQSAQPAGATVGIDDGGQWVVYEPAAGPDVAGSFSYTIADQFGNQATGLVTVELLNPSPDPTLNIVSIQDGPGGSVFLTFVGIPGLNYDIQAKEVLDEGVPWVTLAQRTAGPNGHFTFTDVPPTPVRFYRAVGP